MKFLSCLILSACLFVCGYAIDEQVQKANDYIDMFIEKATKESGGFIDPLSLQSLNKTVEREGVLTKFTGVAKLYDGKIHGLSSIKRKGNATVIDLDDILLIACQMTFKKIHATYKGALLVNELGPKITLDAKIGSSDVSLFMMAPAEGGNCTLASFTVNKLKDIRVSIFGLGPWGWAASIISNLALNALEKPVAKAASLKCFDHFSRELEKVPYPG